MMASDLMHLMLYGTSSEAVHAQTWRLMALRELPPEGSSRHQELNWRKQQISSCQDHLS